MNPSSRRLGPTLQLQLLPADHQRFETLRTDIDTGASSLLRQLVHEALRARES